MVIAGVASPVSSSHVMYGVVATGVLPACVMARVALYGGGSERLTTGGGIVWTSQVLDCAPPGGWQFGEGTQRHTVLPAAPCRRRVV